MGERNGNGIGIRRLRSRHDSTTSELPTAEPEIVPTLAPIKTPDKLMPMDRSGLPVMIPRTFTDIDRLLKAIGCEHTGSVIKQGRAGCIYDVYTIPEEFAIVGSKSIFDDGVSQDVEGAVPYIFYSPDGHLLLTIEDGKSPLVKVGPTWKDVCWELGEIAPNDLLLLDQVKTLEGDIKTPRYPDDIWLLFLSGIQSLERKCEVSVWQGMGGSKNGVTDTKDLRVVKALQERIASGTEMLARLGHTRHSFLVEQLREAVGGTIDIATAGSTVSVAAELPPAR